MKDRIMNTLMLLTVAVALVLTLLRGAPEQMDAAFDAPIVAGNPAAFPTNTPHPADAYRLERAETRRQEQIMLQALIDSAFTAPETRALAETQILQAASQMETELAVEAALAGKGYAHALCVARENTVTVMTGTELSARDAALLMTVITEASGVSPENPNTKGDQCRPYHSMSRRVRRSARSGTTPTRRTRTPPC